jgi:hypothetical protein
VEVEDIAASWLSEDKTVWCLVSSGREAYWIRPPIQIIPDASIKAANVGAYQVSYPTNQDCSDSTSLSFNGFQAESKCTRSAGWCGDISWKNLILEKWTFMVFDRKPFIGKLKEIELCLCCESVLSCLISKLNTNPCHLKTW